MSILTVGAVGFLRFRLVRERGELGRQGGVSGKEWLSVLNDVKTLRAVCRADGLLTGKQQPPESMLRLGR